MRAWNWNVTDLKKTIFDLINTRYFPIWQSKEMSNDFVRGQSVAETCFSHWGQGMVWYGMDHTLSIARALYFPISQSNEHRLHI